MQQQVRWGICGTGKICQDFVNALQILPKDEHKVVAVGASNLERAKSFATSNGIENYFGSYVDLAKFSDIDIVYVGVVNNWHKISVLNVLNNGKNVLCEKPMGVNAAEVKEMVDLARKKKLFLMEGYWSRFFPVYKLINTDLENGTIGEPVVAYSNFGFPLGADVMNRDLAGGTLMGIGCYNTMFSMFVFKQKPKTINAVGFLNKQGSDDTASITFTYENGKVFQCMQSASVSLENRAVICGTKGCIKMPSYFWCPNEIQVNSDNVMQVPLPEFPENLKFTYPHSEGLSYEASAVRQCLLAGQTECDLMPLDESLSIAEINDEIRRQLGVKYPQDN